MRILHSHKYHPYHITLNQELCEQDYARRLDFCLWARDQIARDPHYFSHVLFTDESMFHNSGTLNRHNCHYWATENPHWMRERPTQNLWNVNAWGGIIRNRTVGPYFIEGRLNGEGYLNILENNLPDMLDDLPLALIPGMVFMQDGAPPHWARGVRDFLDRSFPNSWIGRGGPIPWPPRSPDLTPCDFFLWGVVKDKVFATQPTTRENMKERITAAFRQIDNDDVARNVVSGFERRINACIQVQGRTFEHLL